eukprot:Ihof_evm14s32 gene=Ihof_evmTU14s32
MTSSDTMSLPDPAPQLSLESFHSVDTANGEVPETSTPASIYSYQMNGSINHITASSTSDQLSETIKENDSESMQSITNSSDYNESQRISVSDSLEVFKSIFRGLPLDEELIEVYICALQQYILLQGRLYITTNYCCFHSNIIGWETVLTLKFQDIISIEKMRTAILFPNAIQIQTKHQKFTFSSFMSRNLAYERLIELWEPTQNPNMTSLSDPAIACEIEAPKSVTRTGKLTPAPENLITVKRIKSSKPSPLAIATSQPLPLPPMEDMPSTKEEPTSASRAISSPASTEAQSTNSETISSGDKMEEDTSLANKDGHESGEEMTGPPVDCMCGDDHGEKDIFNEVYQSDVITVFNTLYGCKSEFNQSFLINQCGYIALTDPEWVTNEDNFSERNVSYTKPLKKNMVGPVTADVEEKQVVLKDDGNKCKVVHIECHTPTLPYGDYFYSVCRMCITHESKGRCRVRCTATVVWEKSTMLKGYITKSTYEGIEGQNLDSAKALHVLFDKGQVEEEPIKKEKNGITPIEEAETKGKIKERWLLHQFVGHHITLVLSIVMAITIMLLIANCLLLVRVASLENALNTWADHQIAASNIDLLLAGSDRPRTDDDWLKLLRAQQRLAILDRQSLMINLQK